MIKKYLLLAISFSFAITINAQGFNDSTNTNKYKKLSKFSTFVKQRLEFSAYVQFQWNYAVKKPDSIAINSASGGYFDRGIKNRFTLRRGRFVVKYVDKYSEVKMQMDLNERGIFLNDFYGKLKDPWLDIFALTGGIFERPFGYELGNPSKKRDIPERSMLLQTIFPNTRDLGAMLTIKAPDSTKAKGLAFHAAIFGGNSGKAETNYKDFVGQLRYDRDFGKKTIFHLGLGVSGLYGEVRHTYDIGNGDPQGQKYIFNHGYTDTTTTKGFLVDSIRSFRAGRYGGKVPRYYYNVDIELGVKWKLGKTSLTAEYTAGRQVSKEANLVNTYNFTSYSPTGLQLGANWSFFNAPNSYNPAMIKQIDFPAHTFIRYFRGGTITFEHEFEKPKLFVTFHYEWYDPNIKVKGTEIKTVDRNGYSTFLSPADIKYQIFQAGIGYKFTKNIKFSFHYDRVINEKTGIEPVPFNNDLINSSFVYPNSGWKEDVKDDIITMRLQIGF